MKPVELVFHSEPCFITADYWLQKEQFFDSFGEREQFKADALHSIENCVLTDMLSKEVETHLVDSGQGNELLGIQIDQPGKKVWSVLDRGGNIDWPRGVYKLSGNRAALNFDQMLSNHEFLRWQVEHLAGFISKDRLPAEIAATSARAT